MVSACFTRWPEDQKITNNLWFKENYKKKQTNSYTIPFLVSCCSRPILRMPVPVMLSTCAIAVFSTEPWNLWILSNQSTSSIMVSCGHTAKELKERVDVWGTGVEGGGAIWPIGWHTRLSTQWPGFDSWSQQGKGLVPFFWVKTCLDSPACLAFLCTQHALRLLCMLQIPCPPSLGIMTSGMGTHRPCITVAE